MMKGFSLERTWIDMNGRTQGETGRMSLSTAKQEWKIERRVIIRIVLVLSLLEREEELNIIAMRLEIRDRKMNTMLQQFSTSLFP
jgi:hypothetical protein